MVEQVKNNTNSIYKVPYGSFPTYQASPSFAGNTFQMPQFGSYDSFEPRKKQEGFLQRNKGKLIIGTAILGAVAAAFPQTRFFARNLFGKKGIAEFLKSSAEKPLKDIIEEAKGIEGFEKAAEGMSYFNLKRLAQNLSENKAFYNKALTSSTLGSSPYDLYRNVSGKFKPIARFFEASANEATALSKDGVQKGTLPDSITLTQIADKPGRFNITKYFKNGSQAVNGAQREIYIFDIPEIFRQITIEKTAKGETFNFSLDKFFEFCQPKA